MVDGLAVDKKAEERESNRALFKFTRREGSYG